MLLIFRWKTVLGAMNGGAKLYLLTRWPLQRRRWSSAHRWQSCSSTFPLTWECSQSGAEGHREVLLQWTATKPLETKSTALTLSATVSYFHHFLLHLCPSYKVTQKHKGCEDAGIMRTFMEGFSANGHPKLELLEKQVAVTHLEA